MAAASEEPYSAEHPRTARSHLHRRRRLPTIKPAARHRHTFGLDHENTLLRALLHGKAKPSPNSKTLKIINDKMDEYVKQGAGLQQRRTSRPLCSPCLLSSQEADPRLL